MAFKLAFALHNHQPVGNFNAVFEEAHNKCYKLFPELVARYPNFRFSLHQSGILWEWQKKHHPEFFKTIGDLVDRGQVELLSGAFYEPILSSIPDRDKAGQITMLNTYLRDHFDVIPRGMWLAERIWEPHLPEIIHDCDLEYLPLDDTHFKYTGMKDDQLYGTYVTEEAGKPLILLPILIKLRYLIPYGEVEDVIEYLRQIARTHPDGVAVYADDGEKFGVWPESHKHTYEDGWLKRFFEAVERNSEWLEIVPLQDVVDTVRPLGRVYLPSASYREMLQWALPADSFRDLEKFDEKLKEFDLFDTYGHFVRGGHWRNFLTKYNEVNLMHKKMLTVSELMAEVSNNPIVDSGSVEEARDALYAGQCNCPYWHGVFGGLYLPHLRWAIYQKLIEAEKILRPLAEKQITGVETDYDRDGANEIVLTNEHLSIVIAPGNGGQIVELDCLDEHVNVVDCLARRREGYHHKLLEAEKPGQPTDSAKSIHDRVKTKEAGLEKLLAEDWYLRRPLSDHFLAGGTALESFSNGSYHELGDFIREPFEYKLRDSSDYYIVEMSRLGRVWKGDNHCPVRLAKKIIFPKTGRTITIDYTLRQSELELMPITFGVEFDFNLLAPDAHDRFVKIDNYKPEKDPNLAALAEHRRSSSIAFYDEYQKLGIQVGADAPGTIWRMPIYTVSMSEDGFEKVFQGTSALFTYETSLASGQDFSISFSLYAGALDQMPEITRSRHTADSTQR